MASKPKPRQAKTVKRRRKVVPISRRLLWLEQRIQDRFQVISEISFKLDNLLSRVNGMDASTRRDIEHVRGSINSLNLRVDRLTVAVYPPVTRGKMACSICKKAEPDVKFTYETDSGQLCESCWTWHHQVKHKLSQPIAPKTLQ